MSAAGGARAEPEPSTDRGSQMPRVLHARTPSTRVLRMLDEIGKRYDTVQLAREDRRCLEPRLDARQLRLNVGLTGSAPRPALPPREKLTGAFTCSDLRASLGLAIAPETLSGAGGSVELASRARSRRWTRIGAPAAASSSA
jgi:hypothetical protein